MKNNLKVTLGSDPELFLFDRQLKKIVSSIPVLKHDKHNPIDLGDGIKMYADNVLVETAFPPCDSKDEILNTFATVFKRMHKSLGSRFELSPKTAHLYEDSELRDKAAWEAGCDPNFNAYEATVNPAPEFTNGLRTGSFHVHIGNKDFQSFQHPVLNSFTGRHDTIRLLDIMVGVPAIIFDKDETSLERRKLYGQAGEFRPTPYGVEYRVLGNFALRSPKCTELVFDLISNAISHITSGSIVDVLKKINPKEVREAINTNNLDLCEKILKQAEIPSKLLKQIRLDYNANFCKSWGIKT